MSQFG